MCHMLYILCLKFYVVYGGFTKKLIAKQKITIFQTITISKFFQNGYVDKKFENNILLTIFFAKYIKMGIFTEYFH